MSYDKGEIDEYFWHLKEHDEWEQRYLPSTPQEERRQEQYLEFHKDMALAAFSRVVGSRRRKLGRNQNVQHDGEVYYLNCPKEDNWKTLIVRGKQEICTKRECLSCV